MEALRAEALRTEDLRPEAFETRAFEAGGMEDCSKAWPERTRLTAFLGF